MPVCWVPLVPDHLFIGSCQGAVAAAGAAGVAGLLVEPRLPATQPHAPAESSWRGKGTGLENTLDTQATSSLAQRGSF